MLYAVSIAMLGYTRLQSVTVYNSETRAFDELTPAVARRYIKSGQVVGIEWKEADNYDKGEFVPDKEGFNKQNIMVRTAAGKFRPFYNDKPGQPINSMYNVVRIIYTDYRGVLYEVVSNRFDRIKLTEEQLRGLNSLEPVAGVWIHDDHIVSAGCITVEDRRESATKQDNQVESSEQTESTTKVESVEHLDPADTVEDVDTAEAVETAESAEQPQTMEDIFGSAGVSEGEQSTESESEASESEGENQDVDQAEQPLKMKPVFSVESHDQEQKKSAGSKAAGSKNKRSAANKKK